MNIANIVATRFSLRIDEGWARKAYGDEKNRGDWFRMRAELFKATLHRSLFSQSVRPLAVFLLLDEGDRDFYEACLTDTKELVTPVFSRRDDLFTPLRTAIQHLGVSTTAISRIDSDDLIATDYLERTNEQAQKLLSQGVNSAFVVACRGYRTDYASVQDLYYNCSPFLTLVERSYTGRNVYGLNHEHVVEQDHLLDHDARWVQVIHRTNVSNMFLQTALSPDEFDARIVLNPKLIASTLRPLAIEELTKFPALEESPTLV